jgi:hypothetical protein
MLTIATREERQCGWNFRLGNRQGRRAAAEGPAPRAQIYAITA